MTTEAKKAADVSGKDDFPIKEEPTARAAVQRQPNDKLAMQVKEAEIKAIEAREKADKAAAGATSKEEVAAQEAATALDDLRAKAAEEQGLVSAAQDPHTVYEAKVLAVVAPETLAGDHMAQNFGNDPENPKSAPGLKGDATVRMSRVTPDVPGGPVIIDVHPDMAGDYARAGWNKD